MENIRAENNVLKTKLQSCYGLKTFYHETRQEIASLSHQIYLKDSTIADLETRLGRYESTCIKVDGEEPVVYGPSKTLFASLCKEINTIKLRLADTETATPQRLETTDVEIEGLQQSVWEVEQETRGILSGPWHHRDPEDRRLRWALAEDERARVDGAALCSSLAEEADQLRAQLGATVRVCQGLLKKLERQRQGDGSADKQTHDLQGKEFVDSSKATHLNTLVCKLQEENRELKQRVAYVENLNSKWQKYDLSREEYVKGLCKKLKEVNPLAGLGSGAGQGPVPVSNTLLQQEIVRLNCLLDEKMKDCAKLSRELEDSRKQDMERIQTLEQQVLIYTDDFNIERADRERAQSRVQDLQEEVTRLQMKLRKKQESRDPPPACWVHIGHRMTPHLPAEAAEPLLGNSADQLGPQRSGGQMSQATVRKGRGTVTDLQCPRCFTCYDEDHVAEYLKHCEECANL
ncbi:hypothetical protein AGOR_G00191470 [Albula goreensis]|uniref:TNFAIP3-interacting protein 2 n=1 Tax=Albula goreensis TaxID=1534307 RepID=A0A8T3CUY7_9TELE|nr:hypothetical protein AGOR_G00191470 [Albula goreensis]